MTKSRLRLILIVLLALPAALPAQEVSFAAAKQAAAAFYNTLAAAKQPADPQSIRLAGQIDNPALGLPALYLLNVGESGFVVVSASDRVEPILAYSPNDTLCADRINPACADLLQSYADLVSACQNSAAPTPSAIAGRWEALLSGAVPKQVEENLVLVQTAWGQGGTKKPSYNMFSPMVGEQYCLAGCVATAMAQVVRYWRAPVKGAGTAAYAWNAKTISYRFQDDSNKFVYDSMINKIYTNSPRNCKRAISKLMYACGVSVKMNWGVSGSAATTSEAAVALPKYFRYDSEIRYLTRQEAGTSARWVSLLHEEIDDNRRPVIYRASSSGSGSDANHCFVVCGTTTNDANKFYINWGWTGSNDGFYTLNPLSAVESCGSYTYNKNHAMVYRIHPAQAGIADQTEFSPCPAYPNPATDYLMIPAALPLTAALTVYAADGRMVERLAIPGGVEEYRLDLSRYPSGAYCYRLNGQCFKFIVR